MKDGKIAIIVAVIGLIGVTATALINNWGNIFSNSKKSEAAEIDTQKKEKIIFEDHFDDNHNGWGIGNYPWGTEEIKNGKFIINVSSRGDQAFITIPHLNISASNSFSIDMTTRWLGNQENGAFYGYGFSRDPFSFLIFANGDRRLVSFNPVTKSIESVVVDWGGANSSIRTLGTDINKLKLSFDNGIANLFCNDVKLYSRPISFKSNDLSIVVQGTENIEIDDIVVKSDTDN